MSKNKQLPTPFRHTKEYKMLADLHIGDLLTFKDEDGDALVVIINISPPTWLQSSDNDHMNDVKQRKEDCVCNTCHCYFTATCVSVVWTTIGYGSEDSITSFYAGALGQFEKISCL